MQSRKSVSVYIYLLSLPTPPYTQCKLKPKQNLLAQTILLVYPFYDFMSFELALDPNIPTHHMLLLD